MARIFGDPPTKEIVSETFPAFLREMQVGTDIAPPAWETFEDELTSKILKEEYEALFQIPTARYVTPFESVYMNGRMMGKSSSEVQEFYLKEGLQRKDGPAARISFSLSAALAQPGMI